MIKTLSLSVALALLPGVALAQTSTAKTKTSGKTAISSKATGKSSSKTTVAKAEPKGKKTAAKTAPAAVAAAGAAPSGELGPQELDIAKRVYVGEMACEMGASVRVEQDAQTPGHFQLEGKDFKYRMTPVVTSTGAVRLEDHKAGAVWLQIGNKSMLMDQKRGQRLADECKGPEQVAVAEALKKAPAPNLLDAPASK